MHGLVLFVSLLASGGAAGQDQPANVLGAPAAAATPIWIQDPWSGDTVLTQVQQPDFSLWNGKRIDDYRASLEEQTPPPLAVLTIPSLHIQVPVWNGTEEVNLNRGAGRVKGLARVGEAGNLAISSHRDGFFRGLKDIQVGDEIEIQTPQGVEHYAVSAISIVDKTDLSPLEPTEEEMLTLITCYPFYFVGHAPKRYIVMANPVKPGDG
jgi:sortase A